MQTPGGTPKKKDVAEALLQGPSVFVHLDPRKDGVVVPKWFKGQPQLVLQIGLNMAVPIRDLVVEDDGIGCTLSFDRSPHWCHIPWAAIYALVGEDGRGMVWPEDIPPEVARQVQRAQLKVVDASPDKRSAIRAAREGERASPRARRKGRARKKGAVLEAVPSPSTADERLPSVPRRKGTRKGGGADKKLPPYLRVVK